MAEPSTQFLRPLLSKPNSEPEELSNSGVILRLTSLLFIAILSIYANHDASKGGIDIVIENAALNTPAGRRFSLSYIYNDKAARMALQASAYIEDLLYSDYHNRTTDNIDHLLLRKKQVSRVTVRLIRQNLAETAEVSSGRDNRHFLIQISLAIMDRADHLSEITKTLRRAMARVWIYDDDHCPKPLLDGMVELLANSPTLGGGGKADFIGGDCWMDEDPRQVARFLEECERQREGFIQRLNQGLREGWSDDRTVDNALGIPARTLCGPLNNGTSPQ